MDDSKFVIYGVPRVGSNHLISVLNKHPNVLCHYEIFHKNEIFTGFFDKGIAEPKFGSLENRNNNPRAFLKNIFDANFGFQAIGYNLFPEHNSKVFIESLGDKFLKKIIIKRRDVLRNYISWEIAMQTDIWTQREIRKKGTKDKRIIFNEKQFLRRLNVLNKCYNFIETALSVDRQSSFVVYHEDLVREPKRYLAMLFEFIGVPSIEVNTETGITKQNTEKLEELIINYDEFLHFCDSYLDRDVNSEHNCW